MKLANGPTFGNGSYFIIGDSFHKLPSGSDEKTFLTLGVEN